MWGHLTVHFKLDTNGAPSWKPLPYLFTVPYAVFGHYALWLWMITAVAVSLSGLVFAWRVAFWLVDAPPQRRLASRPPAGRRAVPVPPVASRADNEVDAAARAAALKADNFLFHLATSKARPGQRREGKLNCRYCSGL